MINMLMNMPAMNHLMSEDVNVTALRNPLAHLISRRRGSRIQNTQKPGWVDAVRASRQGR